jgi:hypothetical protein
VLIAIVLGGMPVTIACGQREPPQAPEIPRPAPRIADGAWAGVLAEHPRLLGPRAHLQDLARAKPEAYAEVESQSGRDILATGVVRAVQGLDPAQAQRYVDRALRNVARGVTNTHQDTWIALTNVALAYDLFFDAIAPDDRAEMIEWLNGHLGRYTTDENAFHNSTLSKVLCYLRIAYATWGENERAREFRDHALVSLYEGKIVAVLREFGAGGGFTECGWYSRHSLWHLVQALELARRVEGYDGFQKAPRFFYQRLAYEMLQPYPGLWKEGYGAERYACEGDGSYVYGDHTEYPRDMRTVLAQYFRGSELSRAIANKRRKGSNFDARLVDFLYEEDPDAPLDLKGFPLAHLASGVGKVYARSDWTDDATWFRFECGDLWNHHQHFEVGNFEIFRREPLATESGEYHDYLSSHSVNWLLRTIAHNCILVYQPDETWSTMRDGGRNAYANDGGQTKKWEWVVDTVAAWKQRQEQFELGSIVGYENRPEFLFVAGDCTKAHAPSKLAAWVRQIVFVRPHTFVIFDRVLSTRPEYEKTWLLHCRYEPQIAGNTTTIANGAGRLTVQTLLPERPVVRKVEGYTYRGQTFDPPQTGQSATANRWRVEVLPAEAQTEDIFLHVLTTDEPQDATLLHEGGTIGARVGQVEVRFDGRVGGTLDIAGRQFPLAPEVRTGRYE